MTGFGSASASGAGVSVTAEARSVNNRYLKTTIRGSSALASREHEIEALIRERVARGTVYLNIRVVRDERPVVIRLNEAAVRDYRRLFRKLKKDVGLEGEPTLELIAQLPGVFAAEEMENTLSKEAWEVVLATVASALDRLVRMRKKEGANLKRDFTARRTRVAGLVRQIKSRAPKVAKEYEARLEERVGRLLRRRGVEIEEKDLIRELAVFSERSDVTEEVTRLLSHLAQYSETLKGDGEQGRRLEFLVQEMLREANTIGAKSGDVEVSRLCVELKVELDRLKEQVQNVE